MSDSTSETMANCEVMSYLRTFEHFRNVKEPYVETYKLEALADPHCDHVTFCLEFSREDIDSDGLKKSGGNKYEFDADFSIRPEDWRTFCVQSLVALGYNVTLTKVER